MIVEAYFEIVEQGSPHRFVIKLIEPTKIHHARRIARGREKRRVHVMGTIVRQTAPYNPAWSYHLAPTSITFFDEAVEACDAAISCVEGHVAREVMPLAK